MRSIVGRVPEWAKGADFKSVTRFHNPETTNTYKPDNPDPRNSPSNSTGITIPTDPELAALIDAWPRLPEPVRAAIARLSQLADK